MHSSPKDSQSCIRLNTTEKTLNDIKLENAKIELEKAKNMDEVVKRAEEIFQITVDQAKLDRDLAKRKADDAFEELRLQGEILDAKIKIAEADLTIAKINGKKTEALEKELKGLYQKSNQLQKSLEVEEKIKQKKYEQADAIYKQAVKMAELNKKGRIQAGRERLITAEKKKQTQMEKQNQLQGSINQKQAARVNDAISQYQHDCYYEAA